MSFILDAIKKSDQQRQRGATPTLLTLPAASAEQRSPAILTYWVLAAVTLSIGIAIGWLRPWQAEQPAGPLAAPVKSVPQADVNLPPSPVAAPAVQLQAIPVPRAPAPLPQMQKKLAEALGKAAPASVPVETVIAKSAPVAARALGDLPLEVRREIPEMRVAMHAYSPRPEARIVSINDRLLHEGDSAADGVKLEEITPDGMIFSYKEFRFRRGVR